MDHRDRRAVFLSDVWRILRSGKRHLDVGGHGAAWPARHSSGKRHQEFLGHLHQQRRGLSILIVAPGFVAESVAHGRRGFAGWVFWIAHRATRRPESNPADHRLNWICDYVGDVVADEVKNYCFIDD